MKTRQENLSRALIVDLLQRYQIRPNKLIGQNFLVDDKAYADIISSANLSIDDTVLEIGAGLGTLTEKISLKVKKLITVEVDVKLAQLTKKRLSNFKNIELINADVLSKSVKDFGINQPYKVVANIPYNITSTILKKFLADDIKPIALTLLIQHEVGKRVIAKKGEMSLLSLSVQLYSSPKIISMVPRTSFLPSPKVDSVILQIDNVHDWPFKDVSEKFYWRIAKIGFSARRKYLKNNLMAGLRLSGVDILSFFKKSNINTQARAQELSIDDWRRLSVILLNALN